MLRKAVLFLYGRLERPARRFDRFLRLVKREIHSPAPVGAGDRLGMWRRGFLGESLAIYRLDRNDPAGYVTDFQRHVRTPDINGRYRFILQDKLLFARVMQSYPMHAVPSFGVVRAGRMHFTGGKNLEAATYLRDLLRREPRLVLKPLAGGGGTKIRFLRREDDRMLLNGQPLSEPALARLVGSMREDVVVAYVEQRPEIAALYPRTVNTLRLLTMWDEESGNPFVAAAVLRIGSAASYPVDNWTQGGLTAWVNLQTGLLGPGVSHPGRGTDLAWHSRHPETGAAIEGFALPGWSQIQRRMLEICRSLPFLLYVGWDLILTPDGFRILEGNHYPDLNLMQVHRPLLTDPRIARFYATHGVLQPGADRQSGVRTPAAEPGRWSLGSAPDSREAANPARRAHHHPDAAAKERHRRARG
jgi:hypothetical protein